MTNVTAAWAPGSPANSFSSVPTRKERLDYVDERFDCVLGMIQVALLVASKPIWGFWPIVADTPRPMPTHMPRVRGALAPMVDSFWCRPFAQFADGFGSAEISIGWRRVVEGPNINRRF